MLQKSTSVNTLKIRKCSFSRPLCRVCLPITLKGLTIWECKKLEFLLPEFFKCHHPSLLYLHIYEGTCNSFLSFPLGNFPRCHSLQISYLEGLEFLSISTSDGDPRSFSDLDIFWCPNLVSICCKNMEAACFRSLTRVFYGNTLFGKKKIKMSTASKIFSKLVYIAGVGNRG